MEQTELYVLMTLIPGLGPVTENKMLNIFGDIKSCFRLSADQASTVTFAEARDLRMYNRAINAFFKHKDDPELAKKAAEIVEASIKQNIQLITRESSAYPHRFTNLHDTPILLYTKGTLRINDFPKSLGIVGARRCTAEGKQRAIEAATSAVKENTAIISGMAKGIDSYAHTACIKEGGYTIAVLGNGPDICYPKEHQILYEAIIRTGCILSEYPPGTSPTSYNFPLRNRIIAALSDELCIIDAGKNSGTNYTVSAFHGYEKTFMNSPVALPLIKSS